MDPVGIIGVLDTHRTTMFIYSHPYSGFYKYFCQYEPLLPLKSKYNSSGFCSILKSAERRIVETKTSKLLRLQVTASKVQKGGGGGVPGAGVGA